MFSVLSFGINGIRISSGTLFISSIPVGICHQRWWVVMLSTLFALVDVVLIVAELPLVVFLDSSLEEDNKVLGAEKVASPLLYLPPPLLFLIFWFIVSKVRFQTLMKFAFPRPFFPTCFKIISTDICSK